MAVMTRLPLGIENFEEMRTSEYYYIDKTGLIKDVLNNLGKVNLFTRPRRFGKTLNMSMLKYFFEMDSDRTLFDGLAISEDEHQDFPFWLRAIVWLRWNAVSMRH